MLPIERSESSPNERSISSSASVAVPVPCSESWKNLINFIILLGGSCFFALTLPKPDCLSVKRSVSKALTDCVNTTGSKEVGISMDLIGVEAILVSISNWFNSGRMSFLADRTELSGDELKRESSLISSTNDFPILLSMLVSKNFPWCDSSWLEKSDDSSKGCVELANASSSSWSS
ncbi:hypothetical protein WICPIJ_000785 [Wickerhamomyces pijperi]|uniref:Uncharacterized protein n=1 Tax=Wickerhamomyces pijperi TaxID=599730 RepID=A0A9P8TRJ9_WICPI|nr:hypothetical protein WICPIJ_000785 [Wickerhamomyces pijperi]